MFFQRTLHRHTVDDRGQHPHVVALHAVDAGFFNGGATKDIAAADDNGDFYARVVHPANFSGVIIQYVKVDDLAFVAAVKGFAAEFEENSFVPGLGHGEVSGNGSAK